MTCAASGPLPARARAHHASARGRALPGTGACGQTLTGTPIPGPLTAVPGCCSPVPPGRARRAVRAPGPRDLLGVAWAAGPAATADPLTLKKSGFRGLFSRPAAK